MKLAGIAYSLAICVTVALLAGCGGSQPPIGAPGAIPQTLATAAHADRGKSWMLPEAKSKDLLYVANLYDTTVYSYPQGKLEGKLGGLYEAGGVCVDQKNGYVYVVSSLSGKILKYAHGSKKLVKRLQATTYEPDGCAVDPTTGNLAVANIGGTYGGNVAIYPNGSGSPTTYSYPGILNYYSCGYDNAGNLFVDGTISGNGFGLAELPNGSGAFTTITLNQTIAYPGGVQWDGKYLAVGDEANPYIYEFSIAGSTGTLHETTELGGTDLSRTFWIQNRKVAVTNLYFVGNYSYVDALFYEYPAGGSAVKRITKGVFNAWGLAVSLAPKKGPRAPARVHGSAAASPANQGAL